MPIVTYGNSWSDAVPEALKFDIALQRILYAAKEPVKFLEEALDIECIPYLMTASLQYVLDSDWTDIYVHCTREYVKLGKSSAIDLPEFNDVQLNDYQRGQLRGLKRFVRQAQIKEMKRQKREHKSKGKV